MAGLLIGATGCPTATDPPDPTYTISGHIRNAQGQPVTGYRVFVYQNNTQIADVAVDSNGEWSVSGLPISRFMVVPYMPDQQAGTEVTFEPTSRDIITPPGSSNADFTVTQGATLG